MVVVIAILIQVILQGPGVKGIMMITTVIAIAAMIVVMTSAIVIFKVAICVLEHFSLDYLRISLNMLIFAADFINN